MMLAGVCRRLSSSAFNWTNYKRFKWRLALTWRRCNAFYANKHLRGGLSSTDGGYNRR